MGTEQLPNFETGQNNNTSIPQPKMKCDTTQFTEDRATGTVNSPINVQFMSLHHNSRQ